MKAEIAENPVALKFNINAVMYLIPEEKKLGKFEKFGFYCENCDAYMTGQIQLVMVIKKRTAIPCQNYSK